MSVNDTSSSSSETLTAEFRDGRLQIVEYSPAGVKGEDEHPGMEVVDTDYIHIGQLGNLNFTIASCDQPTTEGDYAIISDESEHSPQEYVLKSNNSGQQEIKADMEQDESSYVIMFNADDEDDGEYVVLDDDETNGKDSYVVVHGKEGPMLFLQSQLQITQQPPEPTATVPKKAIPTALELLKKAKAVKQAEAILRSSLCSSGRNGTATIPSAKQLLQSPDFKIYLYSCKQCDFKCNHIKQMTEHKAKEHLKKRGNTKTRYPYKNSLGGGRSMQCARCPYRATIISDLLKHVTQSHPEAQVEQQNEATKKQVEQQNEGTICQFCGIRVQSSSLDDLGEHICIDARTKEAEQKQETFKCQACGAITLTQDDLGKHIEMVHPLTFLAVFPWRTETTVGQP